MPGNGAIAEATDEAIYLAIAIRNLGAGIAVLQAWCFSPELLLGSMGHAPLDEFHRLTRDIYIAGGETGFWQGTFRDPTSPEFAEARDVLLARQRFTVEILYGDNEGGQRTISRFAVVPRDEDGWIAAVGRHWNIDRPDPR